MSRVEALVINSFESGGGAEVVYREMVSRYAASGPVATLSGEASPREGHARVPNRKGSALAATLLSPVLALAVFLRLGLLLASRRPRVAVVHNLWPNVGVGGLAALALGRAVLGTRCVLVAHDFQYACATSMAFDFGRGVPCRDCIGRRVKAAPLARGCDKGGRAASAAKALRLLGAVGPLAPARVFDAVVAPSRTVGDALVADGFPEGRVAIVPNGLPPVAPARGGRRDVALFAGRLEPEKGADVIPGLAAALAGASPGLRLLVCGEGSLSLAIRRQVEDAGLAGRVEFLGQVPRDEVLRLASEAKVFVFPSRWAENCPLSLAEAVACGAVPVVGEDCGGAIELLGRIGIRPELSPVEPGALALACARAAAREAPADAAARVAREHGLAAAARRTDAIVFGPGWGGARG